MSLEDDLATLSFNTDSAEGRPIYQQLASHLRQLIKSARLSPQERLPSSRKLALQLGISRTSTLNAYDQLVAEGLLITRPASGVFVSALADAANTSVAVVSDPVSGDDQAIQQIASVEAGGIFDGGPDVEQFPFSEWSRSLAKVWRRPDPALLRDRHPGGYWPLRQAVCRFVKAVRGVDCRPQQVIITAGNRDALSLIGQLLLQQGDTVVLENPCYPPLRHGLLGQGAKLQHCDVDAEGMGLPKGSATLAWMTPARQYPLAMTMTTQRRLDWLDYSRQQQCWLLEDDYDAEFHYRKAPLATLFSMASQLYAPEQQRVVFVGSFSKLMFRTLRIGYLILPEVLVEPAIEVQNRLGTLASVPVQPALADFLGHRRFASHLRRMRRCYQQRRDYLHGLLQEHLGDYVQTELPDGGMHLLARLKSGGSHVDDRGLEQQLAKQGIYAPALSRHYAFDEQMTSEQGLLLGFSGTPEGDLEHGVKQLQQRLLHS
ncbi:MAG: PLP-dependent aminotransferase family protein [Motiliproteus sp.]